MGLLKLALNMLEENKKTFTKSEYNLEDRIAQIKIELSLEASELLYLLMLPLKVVNKNIYVVIKQNYIEFGNLCQNLSDDQLKFVILREFKKLSLGFNLMNIIHKTDIDIMPYEPNVILSRNRFEIIKNIQELSLLHKMKNKISANTIFNDSNIKDKELYIYRQNVFLLLLKKIGLAISELNMKSNKSGFISYLTDSYRHSNILDTNKDYKIVNCTYDDFIYRGNLKLNTIINAIAILEDISYDIELNLYTQKHFYQLYNFNPDNYLSKDIEFRLYVSALDNIRKQDGFVKYLVHNQNGDGYISVFISEVEFEECKLKAVLNLSKNDDKTEVIYKYLIDKLDKLDDNQSEEALNKLLNNSNDDIKSIFETLNLTIPMEFINSIMEVND